MSHVHCMRSPHYLSAPGNIILIRENHCAIMLFSVYILNLTFHTCIKLVVGTSPILKDL